MRCGRTVSRTTFCGRFLPPLFKTRPRRKHTTVVMMKFPVVRLRPVPATNKIEMALAPSTRTDRPEYRPEYIWNNLERIHSENDAKYVTIVQDLLITDQRGKYWSIGARSSKWYTYENGRWVVDQPTGMMRIMRRSSSILGIGPAFKATPATLRRPSRNTCDYCGAVVVPSDDFCINCGHKLVPRP